MHNVKRIDGPHIHGSRVRLRVTELNGRLRYLAYEIEAERARKALERALVARDEMTFEDAIIEYEKSLIANGNKRRGIPTTLWRLRMFFQPISREKVAALTEARGATLLDALATRPSRQGDLLSVDTRKNTFAEAKTFTRWLRTAGHIKTDVLAGFKMAGRHHKGKPRLRYAESDRFFAKALTLAEGGDQGALAVLVAYDGNLRSSEVWSRVVRDLDRGGAVIWIEDAKTDAGNRAVELSEAVARLLAAQAKGKKAEDRLFPEAAALNDPKGWMIPAAVRVCKAAGLPRVTPHGLRGSGATTDLIDEVVSRVSKQLGHTATAVTAGHYLDGDVLAQLRRLVDRSKRAPEVGPKPVPSGAKAPAL